MKNDRKTEVLVLFCFVVGVGLIAFSLWTPFSPTPKEPIHGRSLASLKEEPKSSSLSKLPKVAPQKQSAGVSNSQIEKPENWDWQTKSDVFERLPVLLRCYQVEGACGFSQKDPKAEFFAIGQQIKKELLVLQDQVFESGEKNDRLSQWARQTMSIPDGHVKSAALHLMSTQEPSQENLLTILDEILDYHDAGLIQQAMLELDRYKDAASRNLILTRLEKVMLHGSPLVATEVSRYLSLFMDSKNLGQFQSWLSKLTFGSESYRNLKSQIENFRKAQTAA